MSSELIELVAIRAKLFTALPARLEYLSKSRSKFAAKPQNECYRHDFSDITMTADIGSERFFVIRNLETVKTAALDDQYPFHCAEYLRAYMSSVS